MDSGGTSFPRSDDTSHFLTVAGFWRATLQRDHRRLPLRHDKRLSVDEDGAAAEEGDAVG